MRLSRRCCRRSALTTDRTTTPGDESGVLVCPSLHFGIQSITHLFIFHHQDPMPANTTEIEKRLWEAADV